MVAVSCKALALRAILGIACLGLAAPLACVPAEEPLTPPTAPSATEGEPTARPFTFLKPDGKIISDTHFRGRMTVIVLVATYDTASQAQVRFLNGLMRNHAPRINGLVLALEPQEHAPLVQAFADSLDIQAEVALADRATVAGRGPFPELHHVPSVVILDRQGREVWRKLGLVDGGELSAALQKHE